MDSALYTAASGMIARQRDLEVTANNLANASVVGFRPEGTFYELWRRAVDARVQKTLQDSANSGVYVPSTFTQERAGSVEQTGAPLDVAIEGEGWLVVGTRGGERYTRNGSLRRAKDGTLVTSSGAALLGKRGPIVLGAGRVEIDDAGRIKVDGEESATLRLVSPASKDLIKEGNNLYKLRPGAPAPPAKPDVVVRQGSLESSAVEPVEEMIRLIEAQRKFELHERTVQLIMNEINRRSVNDLVP